MRFNLAEHRRVFVAAGPYKSLTEDELGLLVDGDIDTVGLDVSSGETLAVVCDLGARYRLDEVKYYYDEATLGNLSFFGRQGEGTEFPLIELSHTVAGSIATVDLTSSDDRYEFIRVVHTVLTGTSTVYELEIVTDDDQISFGEAAEITVFSVDSGTSTLLPEKVAIYNPASIELDLFCLLDAEDSDSIGLQLGPTSSGVFSSLYTSGIAFPDDFSWSSGQFENTEEDSGAVILTSGTVSGTYYTPVLDISSLQGRRLFWQTTLSGTAKVDDYGSEDSVPVIGVRFSSQAPTDGGWVSGQLSTDSNWAIGSGTLAFEPHDNNRILNPQYTNYFQARLEFHTAVSGTLPILTGVGIEEGLQVTVSGNSFNDIYVKSTYTEHVYGRESKLIVWFFESRNEKQ